MYEDTLKRLQHTISQCEFRIKATEDGQSKLIDLDRNIKVYETLYSQCNNTLVRLRPYIKDIQAYIADKRTSALQSLNNALRIAGEIVPAAMKGIAFNMERDEAWIETEDAVYASSAEGSGYKEIVSVLSRLVVNGLCESELKTVFLDEPLAKLSPERTALLSQYLTLIVDNQQIILIEQKREVYANVSCTLYEFVKDGDFTTVKRISGG